MQKYKKQLSSNGFSLVELLVTIVVIGILVAIVAVSYVGIRQKAIVASLQSDLSDAYQKLILDKAINFAYPNNLDEANDGKGITASSGTTFSYSANNTTSSKTFCLDAKNGDQSYNISSQYSTPTIGPCSVLYLDAGIAASYPGSGTTLTDLSGNGNNGTLVGGFGVNGLGYSSTNGGSLTFDGVDDYVNAGTNSIFQNQDNHSVEAWVKSTVSGRWQFIGGYYNNGVSDDGYALCITTGGYFAFIESAHTSWDYAISTKNAADSQWHHLIGVRRSGVAYIYVDGVQLGTTTALTPSFSLPKILIGWQGTSNQAFSGLISSVRVYNRALTSTEITQNFNALRERYGL